MIAAGVVGASLAGCTAKETKTSDAAGENAPRSPSPRRTPTAKLSATTAATGPSTFVITNNGTKVTEFYVYGEGERVMGEVEKRLPGLQRKLIVRSTSQARIKTACKAGHGRRRYPQRFHRHRTSRQGRHRGQVQRGWAKPPTATKEYVEHPDRKAHPGHRSIRPRQSRRATSPPRNRSTRPPAPTYERIEPVAESFPDNLDPASTCAKPTSSLARSGRASTG